MQNEELQSDLPNISTKTQKIIIAWKKFQATVIQLRKKRRSILRNADKTYSEKRIQEIRSQLYTNKNDNDHSR